MHLDKKKNKTIKPLFVIVFIGDPFWDEAS